MTRAAQTSQYTFIYNYRMYWPLCVYTLCTVRSPGHFVYWPLSVTLRSEQVFKWILSGHSVSVQPQDIQGYRYRQNNCIFACATASVKEFGLCWCLCSFSERAYYAMFAACAWQVERPLSLCEKLACASLCVLFFCEKRRVFVSFEAFTQALNPAYATYGAYACTGWTTFQPKRKDTQPVQKTRPACALACAHMQKRRLFCLWLPAKRRAWSHTLLIACFVERSFTCGADFEKLSPLRTTFNV